MYISHTDLCTVGGVFRRSPSSFAIMVCRMYLHWVNKEAKKEVNKKGRGEMRERERRERGERGGRKKVGGQKEKGEN